jgi:hypothetical protein
MAGEADLLHRRPELLDIICGMGGMTDDTSVFHDGIMFHLAIDNSAGYLGTQLLVTEQAEVPYGVIGFYVSSVFVPRASQVKNG